MYVLGYVCVVRRYRHRGLETYLEVATEARISSAGASYECGRHLDTCRFGLCRMCLILCHSVPAHLRPQKSEGEPHPLCESCALIHDVALCTPSATCALYEDTGTVVLKRILKSRRKREYRLRVRLTSAGDRMSASARKSAGDNKNTRDSGITRPSVCESDTFV